MVFLFLPKHCSKLRGFLSDRHKVKEVLIVLFGLLCGLWFISLGAVHYDLLYFPGDLADARFNNYLLEHGYRFFKGSDAYFWGAEFMYPERDVISYSDNLIGTVPIYGAYRVFGADRETAFQLWSLSMVVLNYLSAFFFLRFLVKNSMAAVIGAMIFAFSMALHSQMVHAQTFPRFMIPLALWAALLYQKDLRPRYLFYALLAWVYQMYCGIYLGFMLLIPLLIVFISSFISRRKLYQLKIKNRRWWVLQSLAVGSNLLILLPLMLPYLRRSAQTGFYPYEQVIKSLPTPASYFYSRHGTMFWQANQDLCVSYQNFWDFILFPGGIALLSFAVVLVIFAVTLFKKQFTLFQGGDSSLKLFIGVGFIVWVLFMKFGEFSFYSLIYYLPGFGSMRALQRIINLELLVFGAAAAVLAAKLIKQHHPSAYLYFIVAVVMVLADNYVLHDHFDKSLKEDAQLRVQDLIQKIDTSSSARVLSYEPDTVLKTQIYFQLDAMMAAQSLGMKTLNGYSATSPAGYDAYWRMPNAASRRAWLQHTGLDSNFVQTIH